MAVSLPKTMKAVGVYKYLPLTDPESFHDLEVSVPEFKKNQLLIQVKAAAINPVDSKLRRNHVGPDPRILGIDGAGIVVAKGEDVKTFNVGDEVIFLADLRHNGTNAQYVAVEEYLVGPKSAKLTFEEAAAMTFAVATAYDMLFGRLALTKKDAGKSFLIINSGGGVGTAASQLANNLGLNVIGTASRKETEEISLKNGAHVVLNHSKDLLPQLEANGYSGGVDFILINFDPFKYWDVVMKAAKPLARICTLCDCSGLIDIKPLKAKSLTFSCENVTTRILYDTDDKYAYHEMLKDISRMIDNGELKPTVTKILSPLNAANLREAHSYIETKTLVGKLVLSGF